MQTTTTDNHNPDKPIGTMTHFASVENGPAIQVDGLVTYYGERRILDEVNLRVEDRKSVV